MKKSRANQLLERLKKYIEPDDQEIVLDIPILDQNEGKSVNTEEDIKTSKVNINGIRQGPKSSQRNPKTSSEGQTLAEIHAESIDGIMQEDVMSDPEDELSDEEIKAACKKEAIIIEVNEMRYFERRPNDLKHYRYLYWACYRGHVHIVYYILKNFKISPFLVGPDERSPFMAAIVGNQDLIVRLILSKDLLYPQA